MEFISWWVRHFKTWWTPVYILLLMTLHTRNLTYPREYGDRFNLCAVHTSCWYCTSGSTVSLLHLMSLQVKFNVVWWCLSIILQKWSYQLINPWGRISGRHVISPIPCSHRWWSPQASSYTGPLPILRFSGLSLTDKAQCARTAYRNLSTCPYSWGWHWQPSRLSKTYFNLICRCILSVT